MSPLLVFIIIAGYFLVLIGVSFLTSNSSNSAAFFTANRQSPWYLVAFGMIGASLSGVTFISVPGEVGNSNFFYFQMVLGYLAGYLVIGTVLMPLYYRLNLVSIYSYLEDRFGFWSYKTGAFFFLISRVAGAAFRLYLVASVLQLAFFIPLFGEDSPYSSFSLTVLVTIALIWLYTFRGGIKTIVWTDTLQTTFMILTVVVCIILIGQDLSLGFGDVVDKIADSDYSKMFNWEWKSGRNFFKQFFAGAFIAIVMTGLDQDMMQKNLTCKNIGEAQKNMFWFSIVLVFVNLIFLGLGALLYEYAEIKEIAIPDRTDFLFPTIALKHLGLAGGALFLLGITAAAYSSADSALTALTTSFCVDFLEFKEENFEANKNLRTYVHLGFSLLLFLVIIIFKSLNDDSVINQVFRVAGYTYGPLLGLYAYGLFTKSKVNDPFVPLVCVIAPVLSYFLNMYSETLLGGYKFGFEILIVNGLFTFIGLAILYKKQN